MKKLILLTLISVFSLSSHAADNSFNITANPLGALSDIIDVGADYKVSKRFTAGLDYSFLDSKDGSITQKGSTYGTRVKFYFDEALKDGWVLTARLGLIKSDVEQKATIFGSSISAKATAEGTYYGLLGGYMWMWNNFNMHLGLGVINYDVDVKAEAGSVKLEAPVEGTVVSLDYSIGFAF